MSIHPREPDDHDRDTGTADRDTRAAHVVSAPTIDDPAGRTPQLLDTALEQLRLEGAIFFRSELSEPFAFESTPAAMASALHEGAERLTLFHIVAGGTCWVETDGGDRMWAEPGDIIVLPYGDHHTIGGVDPADRVPITSLLDPPPWADLPTIRHGGGGERVDLVCGYLYSEDALFDPTLRALPSAFVVRPPGGHTASWVQSSITYSLETTVPSNASGNPITTRLPALVLTEVLRLHLASAPAADHGWIAALQDPILAPALAHLHRDPARRWTVADLAATSAISRSGLDERFRRLLGRSPIRYLTEWRMHLSRELLLTTDLGVATVARRVGYLSEEAFSRAFKRTYGQSPSRWRDERRASPPPRS